MFLRNSVVIRREIGVRLARLLSKLSRWPVIWRIHQAIENRLLTPPQRTCVCSTNYGFWMELNPGIDKGVELSIFKTGTYEAGTLQVFRLLLCPGDIFFDVGANVGLMTLFVAKLVKNSGLVFSFEPVADINSQLRRNVELNELKNVRIFNTALGSKKSSLKIYSHLEINRGSSSLVPQTDCLEKGDLVKIEPLDSFIDCLENRLIKLIKIDVEGWELEVLRGGDKLLSSDKAPILCIECSKLHPIFGGNIEDIFDFLEKRGYHCFRLKQSKGYISKLIPVTRKSDLPDHDNLFCFPLKFLSDSLLRKLID